MYVICELVIFSVCIGKKEYSKITFVLGYKHQINIVLYFFASDCKRYNFHFLQNICTIVHRKKMNGQMRAMALV